MVAHTSSTSVLEGDVLHLKREQIHLPKQNVRDRKLSAGIGMVQPFALLGLSILSLLSSVVVAYTNDGYLRDAYR
jgi:hypothetical protein